MAVVGPTTGFKITQTAGATGDIGSRYISKDYLLDVYPSIISYGNNPNKTVPGIFSFGDGDFGQNGFAQNFSFSITQVGTLTNWKQVSMKMSFAMAIKTDGTLWSIGGRNFVGQLGNSAVANTASPIQIGALNSWKMVSAGNYHTMAIKTDGTIWAWGGNGISSGKGQLGLGDSTHRSSPVQVGTLTNWKLVTAGAYHTAAIKTDGTLWTWGSFNNGNLGLSNSSTVNSPVQVGTGTTWKQVSTSQSTNVAVKTDGTLWSWGNNGNGYLGLGDITNRSSPVQIGTGTSWKQAICGREHTAAIKTDGTLWIWGSNGYGQLGLSDITARSSPVQVGSLTNWKFIAGGTYHSMAIKTDGTMWSWGMNDNPSYRAQAAQGGQLGLIDRVHRSSPVQVGSLTNWKQVEAGASTSIAILDGNI